MPNSTAPASSRQAESPNKAWMRALALTAPIARQGAVTLPMRIAELAKEFGDAPALIGEEETLTYRALAARMHRYTHWARATGIRSGDVVCLMMQNSPDYLAAWLGITRLGAIVALANTSLTGDSLAHAMRAAAPRCIIVGHDLAPAVHAIATGLPVSTSYWVRGGPARGFENLDAALDHEPDAAAVDWSSPTTSDPALLIYTSGTTGYPKAARVSHRRVMQWSYWFAGLLGTTAHDRMYDCLPMYHSVGGIVAIGSVLVSGGSVVIRKKFSTSAFWDDVVETECTLFQYIGELCRFLVNGAPSPRELDHQLRIACGNGLRVDVWEGFQRRFAIPRILEFYAATEANFSLYNCEGKRGAIGRIPAFLTHRFPITLVAFDNATNEPCRDARGRCRRSEVDEVGEAICEISPSVEGGFEGYTDESASERKILRDVFADGDAWFRSGDLMRRDASGFFYFVDRVGDTFRWKGENVSTNEVADAITAWPEVRQAVVYGVEVPGADGRAGMAAVVAKDDGECPLDLAGLRTHLDARLPEYARPVFLRVLPAIRTTETFKLQKHDLIRRGFDPSATGDQLFVHDRAASSFVPLDERRFQQIHSGELRL